MSVRIIQPGDGSLAEVVRVTSDATENYRAITEIDEWASQNGYTRSNENWLQRLSINNRREFVGTCFRTLAADKLAIEDRISARSDLRARMDR